VSDRDDKFLRLTFDGGRFAGHSVPVGVLAELATFQKLISTVARRLLIDEDQGRERIPRGFAEEAQLFLASTEDNCFTAGLVRQGGSADHDRYFIAARDLSIAALAASAHPSTPLPSAFPREAHRLLAGIGKRLRDDEVLIVRNGSGPQARITKSSRARLAAMVKVPLELEETLEGEVERLDDSRDVFTLRRKHDRLEVHYDRVDRENVAEALKKRPLLGVSFHGLVTGSGTRKATNVEDLALFEHPRADHVAKLWSRLEALSKIEDGWIDGEGVAPASKAIQQAHDVLARLLVDNDWIDRPKVFPNPDGGVQAEWAIGAWMCEVIFSADGSMRGEATQTEDDRDEEIELSAVTAGNADQLAKWLLNLTTDSGGEDRV